mmetsp:Transcript_8171/g.23482  ORF Transcript_8171/g.23482 Transcript_8171/m.23482 type:complete len:128 (+) Transcript_8171:305-688(+)
MRGAIIVPFWIWSTMRNVVDSARRHSLKGNARSWIQEKAGQPNGYDATIICQGCTPSALLDNSTVRLKKIWSIEEFDGDADQLRDGCIIFREGQESTSNLRTPVLRNTSNTFISGNISISMMDENDM